MHEYIMLNRKIKNALNESKAIKTAHLLSLDAFFLHEKMVLWRQMSWQGLFGHFKELKGTTVFWDIKLFTFSGRLSRELVSVLAVIVRKSLGLGRFLRAEHEVHYVKCRERGKLSFKSVLLRVYHYHHYYYFRLMLFRCGMYSDDYDNRSMTCKGANLENAKLEAFKISFLLFFNYR